MLKSLRPQFFLLIPLLAVAGFAQTTASIRGVVSDPTRAAIANAQVEAIQPEHRTEDYGSVQ